MPNSAQEEGFSGGVEIIDGDALLASGFVGNGAKHDIRMVHCQRYERGSQRKAGNAVDLNCLDLVPAGTPVGRQAAAFPGPCHGRNHDLCESGGEVARRPEAVDECGAGGERSTPGCPAVGEEGRPPSRTVSAGSIHAAFNTGEEALRYERAKLLLAVADHSDLACACQPVLSPGECSKLCPSKIRHAI